MTTPPRLTQEHEALMRQVMADLGDTAWDGAYSNVAHLLAELYAVRAELERLRADYGEGLLRAHEATLKAREEGRLEGLKLAADKLFEWMEIDASSKIKQLMAWTEVNQPVPVRNVRQEPCLGCTDPNGAQRHTCLLGRLGHP
jgi:hypothetical protein